MKKVVNEVAAPPGFRGGRSSPLQKQEIDCLRFPEIGFKVATRLKTSSRGISSWETNWQFDIGGIFRRAPRRGALDCGDQETVEE